MAGTVGEGLGPLVSPQFDAAMVMAERVTSAQLEAEIAALEARKRPAFWVNVAAHLLFLVAAPGSLVLAFTLFPPFSPSWFPLTLSMVLQFGTAAVITVPAMFWMLSCSDRLRRLFDDLVVRREALRIHRVGLRAAREIERAARGPGSEDR